MNILHLLYSNSYSGAENVACQIIEMFQQDDRFKMAYCSPDGPIRKSLADRGVPYVPITKLSAGEVQRVIREQKPDIIHAHDFRASMIASQAANKIPVISHLHSNAPWMSHYGIKSLSYALTCPRYRAILTVSDPVFDQYVFGDLFRSKLHVMKNPINVRNIYDRATLYSIEEHYDICFCGRLSKPKNPLFFLDILSQVKKEVPAVKAAIIGDGELREQVEAKISKNQLSSNIELYGFVENPYPIMKECSLLCMPSLWEGLPMAAIEALTLGVPVVCSNAGKLSEIVNDRNGRICESEDQYVQEISALLSNPQYLAKKQMHASAFAEKYDNTDIYCQDLRAIYLSIDVDKETLEISEQADDETTGKGG